MSGPRGEAGYGLETGVGTGIEHAEGVKERPARGRFPARANRGPICHLAPSLAGGIGGPKHTTVLLALLLRRCNCHISTAATSQDQANRIDLVTVPSSAQVDLSGRGRPGWSLRGTESCHLKIRDEQDSSDFRQVVRCRLARHPSACGDQPGHSRVEVTQPMLQPCRRALALLFALTPVLVVASSFAGVTPAVAASIRPAASSQWTSCNDDAVKSAPTIVWERIQGATIGSKGIPSSFWSNTAYRGDIAKIVCYESTYDWHAVGAGQYGWYQMSQSLIGNEGVTWDDYWDGSKTQAAGWYQCAAGERYIVGRYGTPAAAWQHERDYGWY